MISRLGGSALVGASLFVAGCAQADSASFDSAALDTDDRKASYGVGLNIGGQLVDAADRLDRPAFMRGLEDALRGEDPDIPMQELQTVLNTFSQQIQAEAQAAHQRAAESARVAGAAYLADNGAREGVTTTESGLQYEVLRAGDGAMPVMDQRVRLHYRGTLIDGTEFDSSYDGEPVVFTVGGLIQGFNEALTLMRIGSHFRIVIPSDIAYGAQGSGGRIGPNETLIFEIELVEIVE